MNENEDNVPDVDYSVSPGIRAKEEEAFNKAKERDSQLLKVAIGSFYRQFEEHENGSLEGFRDSYESAILNDFVYARFLNGEPETSEQKEAALRLANFYTPLDRTLNAIEESESLDSGLVSLILGSNTEHSGQVVLSDLVTDINNGANDLESQAAFVDHTKASLRELGMGKAADKVLHYGQALSVYQKMVLPKRYAA